VLETVVKEVNVGERTRKAVRKEKQHGEIANKKRHGTERVLDEAEVWLCFVSVGVDLVLWSTNNPRGATDWDRTN
jgi:hypothetical protein